MDWLVEHLRIRPGARIVDLAAGTGKLTRLLVPSGATLVAVEPLEGMREVLCRAVPGVAVVAGVAEALPFAAGSLDAVAVAQAFHWFDAGAAFTELHRALRPGGRVGTMWNVRDRTEEWADRLWEMVDRLEERAPWRSRPDWRAASPATGHGFGRAREATFHHHQVLTPEGVVDRLRGVSHIAALPAPRRAEVFAEVRELLATHPATRGRPELSVPYRVECQWWERL